MVNDVFLDDIVRPEEPPQPSGRGRRPSRADRDRRRKQRRRRTAISLVIALIALGAAAWAVKTYVIPSFADLSFSREEEPAADFPGPGHGSVDVVIPEGATGAQMAEVLVQQGVVQTVKAFTDAFAADPGASSIQPGTYRLLQEMRAADVVAALQNPANRVQTRVTIPEGLRVSQILERLSSVTALPIADFEAALADTAATGLPAEAGGSYEGWLFPATYTWEPGTTPTQMIADMIAEMVRVLDERGVAPENRQAVLTKASLVERESPNAETSPMMARAIENRLAIDMPLQIDAAVAYGLNKSGTELTLDDISPEAKENPYNTYAHPGLPPTPIASPGAASIDAVLSPAEGPWKFWVTINLDTGETRFAESYDEHLQNEELLREWQAANPPADS